MRDEAKSLKQKPPRTSQRIDSLVTGKTVNADKGKETQSSGATIPWEASQGSLATETVGVKEQDFARSRKELGKLFGVTHEAIRIWEESGKLLTLGWERIPHIKSPVKYSRISQPIARHFSDELFIRKDAAPVPPTSPSY